jgi:transcriptional regulator with XRE-family HTH domain
MVKQESELICRLAERVQKLLELHELTQTDFAKKAGVTREQVNRILKCHHECKLSTVEKIANGFGVSIVSLLEPEKKPKKSA